MSYNMEPKMRNEEVIELINCYKKFECLWNFRSPKYKKVELKNKAWMHLAKLFNRDVAEVKKKIKYLRSAYVNERKKVDEAMSTASAGDDIYIPRLFYYDDLHFLDSVIVFRHAPNTQDTRSSSRIEYDMDKVDDELEVKYNEVQDNEYYTEYVSMPSPSPSLSASTLDKEEVDKSCPSPSSNSSSQPEKTDEQPEMYTAQNCEYNKLYQAFGNTIAMQLAQLTPIEANATMDVIHRLVSRDVMRSLMARSKHNLSSSTTIEQPIVKRKRQKK